MLRLFRTWTSFIDGIFRWIERIISAIADILEAKLRRHAKKRKWRCSQYPCWYYFASAAPGWTV
jgi:hypothetical protein